MCEHCNYRQIIEAVDLEATKNRIRILEVIGNNGFPLTAAEIFQIVDRTSNINKVTVYRNLEIFVEKNILERLSTGGRAACFGLAPNDHHSHHPHFFCTSCGRMDCLSPESMDINIENLQKNFAGEIGRIEVRVDGVCKTCLNHSHN